MCVGVCVCVRMCMRGCVCRSVDVCVCKTEAVLLRESTQLHRRHKHGFTLAFFSFNQVYALLNGVFVLAQ